jgi:hypothetical protein
MKKFLHPLLAAATLATLIVAAPGQTVVATVDDPVSAATQGGTFSVTIALVGNAPTVGNVTAAAVAARVATITTDAAHGLLVDDDVALSLTPPNPNLDGTWQVRSVLSPTQFTIFRDVTAATYTVDPGSTWAKPVTPAQAAFRIRWSDGISGDVLTLNPSDSITLTGVGAVGALLVGPVVVDGTSSYVNVTTTSDVTNTDLNPVLMRLSFTVNPAAPLTTIYDITVEPIPVPGAITVGRLKNPTIDFGAGTLFAIPQVVNLATTIDDSATADIEVTATSVQDWMLLDL